MEFSSLMDDIANGVIPDDPSELSKIQMKKIVQSLDPQVLDSLTDELISKGFGTTNCLSGAAMDRLQNSKDIDTNFTSTTALTHNLIASNYKHLSSVARKMISKMKWLEKRVGRSKCDVENMVKKLHVRKKIVSTHIQKYFESLHKQIQRRESDLLVEFNCIIKKKVSKLEKQKVDLDRTLAQLSGNRKLAEKTMREASHEEFELVAVPMSQKLCNMAHDTFILEPCENDGIVLVRGFPSDVQHTSSITTTSTTTHHLPGRPLYSAANFQKIGKLVALTPEKSTATGQGLFGIVQNCTGMIKVVLRDQSGQKINPKEFSKYTSLKSVVSVKVKSLEPQTLSNQLSKTTKVPKVVTGVFDNEDGTLNCEYSVDFFLKYFFKIHLPGEFLLHVLVSGIDIHKSPFKIRVSNVDNVPTALLGNNNPKIHFLSYNTSKSFSNTSLGKMNTNEIIPMGIIQWLGTQSGELPFRNPAKLGIIKMDMSSIVDGFTYDPAGLMCFDDSTVAANSYTKDELESWLSIDLGEGRSLSPTSYAIRNGSDCFAHAVRNWTLEGSNDLKLWYLLRAHINDTAVDTNPGAVALWDIDLNTQKGFRYFCLRQTGMNAYNRHYLMIGGIDLYGVVHQTSEAANRARDIRVRADNVL